MRRFLIWFIIIITLLAVYIDLPATLPRIKFQVGKIKIDKTINRPALDLTNLGIPLRRDLNLKEGLDLAGGTQLTLEADMSKVAASDRNSALEALKGIIERRVNLFGVSEPVVQSSKVGESHRVIVELAGVTNVSEALTLIGQTANLEFREAISASESANISTESAMIHGPYQKISGLTGKDLKKADPAFDQQTGRPVVRLNFNTDGAKKFEDITKRNIGKELAIFLDNQILMAPTVQTVITGGEAVISGSFTVPETKQMAILLNSGALPAPVKVLDQQTIGATLGRESIDKSLVAGIIGLVIVAFFMIGSYGKLGLFADLALVIYTLLVLAIFKLIPVTLTLAGIAGFILSIGMAVDANILIFERMKEEIRWGRSRMSALELGFSRALPSIRDSNVSSLITCAILYWFGSGPVRGFAVTLAIGILASLFTAVTVTRTLLRLFVRER